MASFDTLAPTYDADFTQQPIGQILRARVQERLLTHFSAGEHILEIGCGTGADALFLATHGIQVTATDASDEMLAVTKTKAEHHPSIDVAKLNIANLSDTLHGVPTTVDGVFSNFGALNCIDDWQPLAKWLAERLPSGSKACFGIMAPYCAWEFVWHVLHGKWEIALRRLRGDDFGELRITYPTVKHLTEDFSPYFKRISVTPLGLFFPTSALFDVVQKRPNLMRTLVSLEKRFENTSQLAMFADHYWIEFERL